MVSQIDQRSSKGKPAQAMGEKAQAMVEFALTFPIVLVLVLGLIEGGWLMFVYTSLTAAGREAARYGAGIGNINPTTAMYNDCAGIKAAAIRIGHYAGIDPKNILIYNEHDSWDNTTSPPTKTTTKTEYCTLAKPTTSFAQDDRIVVAININYKPITPLGLIPSFPLHSQNAHTIVLGAKVEALPHVFPAVGQTCDVSKYSVVSQTFNSGNDTVVINNSSGTKTSIVNVLIVWDTTSGPILNSISGIPGLVTAFPSVGPAYTSDAAMPFPAGTNTSFTLNFSKAPKPPVIIRLTLPPIEDECAFGQ